MQPVVNFEFINELRARRAKDCDIEILCNALEKAWVNIGALRAQLKSDFFCQVCKELVEQRANRTIGHHGVTLVQAIAWKQFKSGETPVPLWSDEAQGLANVGSRKALADNRERCVEEGWLIYKNKGPRLPAEYTITIPDPADSSELDAGSGD